MRRCPVGSCSRRSARSPAWNLHLTPRAWRTALDHRRFASGYQTEWERWERSRRNLASFVGIGKGLAQVTAQGRGVEASSGITLGAIGAVGYYSGLRVHDRNGLVDREVAALPARPGAAPGHDRRVPRSFFLQRDPGVFEALLVAAPQEEASRALAAGARQMAARFLREGDEALFSACVVRAHPLEPEPGVPNPALLLLAQRAEPAEARAFWGPLGH